MSYLSRLITAASAALALAAMLLAVVVAGPAASAASPCALRGGAYATSVRLGSQIRSQRTANLTLCTSRVPVTHRNQTVGVDIPGVLHARAVTSRVVTRSKTPGPAHRITAQTHTARIVLLGKIHARAVVARATASTRRHRRLVGRTVVLGLTLNGKNVPEHPKKDQTYALPGLGKIVLNHQVRTRHGDTLTVTVTALRLVLGEGNSAALPAGVITVGHTTSTVHLHR
jgi:hypothetical protein